MTARALPLPQGVSLPTQSRLLAAIPLLLICLLLAGTPLQLSLGGRQIDLGPLDALIAVLVFAFPLWWRTMPTLTPTTLAALALVWWCGASAVWWSVDVRRSVVETLVLVEAVLTFLVCYNVFTVSRYRLFPIAVRVFGVVLSLQIFWAIYRVVTGGDASAFYDIKNLVKVPLGESNYLAIFLEFGIVYELLARRRGWVVMVALQAVALVLTFSRGGIVALAVTLTLAMVVTLLTAGERRSALIIALPAIAGVLLVPLFEMGQIFVRAFDVIGQAASLRLGLWATAMDVAKWVPVTGVGYGAFESVGGLRHAHSTVFQLLAETGVVGLGLFCAAIIGFVAATHRLSRRLPVGSPRRREALAVTLAFAGVLLHSTIEPFFLDRSALWVGCVLGWMVALPHSPAFDDAGRVVQEEAGPPVSGSV